MDYRDAQRAGRQSRSRNPTTSRRRSVGDLVTPSLTSDEAGPLDDLTDAPRTAGVLPPLHAYAAIKDMAPTERPRERLASNGAESLSLAELIAIIWRTGSSGTQRQSALSIAMRAVNEHGGVAVLMAASLSDLERIPGVGPVKAIELKAALELGRRVALASADERMVIRRPRDVVDLVSAGMSHLDSEHLRIVLLSSKNHVMGIRELYRGTLNSSVVRIAELFRDAIRENCASVIVVHNHPSGDPSPSPEDIRMTADAVKAGALLDISVLDHVIIGSRTLQWVSLRERRLGFSDSPV